MLATLILILLASSACRGKVYNTTFNHTTWDNDNWRISTTKLDQGHYQARMSLSNGYIGINVAAAGPFFEVDQPVAGDVIGGWPLFDRRQTFATIAGFYATVNQTNGTNFDWLYQYGGESIIAGIPHWSGLLVESGGSVLNASVPASQISNFNSTLDLKQGLMTWVYTWTPSGGQALNITYRMLVHKLYVNQAAVELSISSATDANVTIIDVLNGDCAVRSEFSASGRGTNQIWSAVKPHWIGNVTAFVYSTLDTGGTTSSQAYENAEYIGGNSSSIAQSAVMSLKGGGTSVISKYVGIASSEAFGDNANATAVNASNTAAKMGFDALLKPHAEEWAEVMPADSVDDFNSVPGNDTLAGTDTNLLTLQITAVTNPWNILQNTVGANAIAAAGNNSRLDIWSIAVGGLGSSAYAGWIFWDAEVWMAPGIVITNPQAAKQIANYRRELFPQAQANVNDSYQGSTNTTKFTPGGAAYPWISGKYGNCTAAGPCFDYEYHLNGDIGLELYNWYVATGDSETFKDEFFPIYDAVAHFYSELVKYNSSADVNGTVSAGSNGTGAYELYNATDPDEYANHVDNPAFTQALIKTHLTDANVLRERFGLEPNETWADIANKTLVPTNQQANIILEYDTMNGTISVKQADVILVDDFLDFPNPQSLSDLDYYAGKQSASGPGMTYGVFSIVANEISPSGCSSYTYDLYGSLPYIRAPWFQYSEQLVDDYTANGGTHPAYPFLTGMGGAHRVAVFGYLGLRLFLDTLNVDPNLPAQIPHIKYRKFYWQGHPISAFSNATHTTLERVGSPLPNANSTYATSSIPVTIGIEESRMQMLAPNSTITIDNRNASYVKTVPGNIAQCQPATSEEDIVPGQFPLSAVDGAVSTKWQPKLANKTSHLVVELSGNFTEVSGFQFDWAQLPPLNYTVEFSNVSFASAAAVNITLAKNGTVMQSDKFDAASIANITAYASNTTNVSLASQEPIWTGKYARLSIYGTLSAEFAANKTGTGATVAEWAIIGPNGTQAQVNTKRDTRRSRMLEKRYEWPVTAGHLGPGRI